MNSAPVTFPTQYKKGRHVQQRPVGGFNEITEAQKHRAWVMHNHNVQCAKEYSSKRLSTGKTVMIPTPDRELAPKSPQHWGGYASVDRRDRCRHTVLISTTLMPMSCRAGRRLAVPAVSITPQTLTDLT